jgi:hypothetical protein
VTDAALDIEDLANRYGPMVLRRCRRLLRDEDEAIDTTFSLEKEETR